MNHIYYNHLGAIAFSIRSASPTFEGITPGEMFQALRQRIEAMQEDFSRHNEASVTEYVEDLQDTYEEDDSP
jgi:hypothetical protein